MPLAGIAALLIPQPRGDAYTTVPWVALRFSSCWCVAPVRQGTWLPVDLAESWPSTGSVPPKGYPGSCFAVDLGFVGHCVAK